MIGKWDNLDELALNRWLAWFIGIAAASRNFRKQCGAGHV